MHPDPRSPDQIWDDDLFSRRAEAEQLIAYIECAAARPLIRSDKKAYTIAVDAQYGEGKSFFLQRLAEHLSLNHPVAFVDAWADDLSDEPLTALAATLKRALEPFVSEPAIQSRFRIFMQKASKVATIASLGLARRGLGLILTGAAVDAAGDVLAGVGEEVQEAVEESLEDVGQGSADDFAGAIKSATARSLMERRVTAFEEGQAAVREMKRSLAAIVASLDSFAHHPPIVIVIDELDRCRPTYAVKLLEEIKHLFDVSGVVFILAMHGDQLSHSVSGAYGSRFDGRSYLRRFIDRQYRLAEPDLEPLLAVLCEKAGLPDSRLQHPFVAGSDGRPQRPSLPGLLARYMSSYGLKARDAFTLVDILQTAFALSNNCRLYAAYLIPLIIGHIQGLPVGTLPAISTNARWKFAVAKDHFHREFEELPFDVVASAFADAVALSDSALMEVGEGTGAIYMARRAVRENRVWDVEKQPFWVPDSYPELLLAVSRFSNPHLE